MGLSIVGLKFSPSQILIIRFEFNISFKPSEANLDRVQVDLIDKKIKNPIDHEFLVCYGT